MLTAVFMIQGSYIPDSTQNRASALLYCHATPLPQADVDMLLAASFAVSPCRRFFSCSALNRYTLSASSPSRRYVSYVRLGWKFPKYEYVKYNDQTGTVSFAASSAGYRMKFVGIKVIVNNGTPVIRGELTHIGNKFDQTLGCWLPDWGLADTSWTKPRRTVCLSFLIDSTWSSTMVDGSSAVPTFVTDADCATIVAAIIASPNAAARSLLAGHLSTQIAGASHVPFL